MDINTILKTELSQFLNSKYNIDFKNIEIQLTKKNFEGDITIVIFPLVKLLRKSPKYIGNEIGVYLINNSKYVESYNLIQGFVNLVIDSKFYIEFLNEIIKIDDFGLIKPNASNPLFLVEYSSPNTNKPLHLGHIRNILLGYSISKILEASGKNVHKTQIINDRGIHICKSIIAWLKYGKNTTPIDTGDKGDLFVGKYYVLFDKIYKEEISDLIKSGQSKLDAEKNASIFLEAQNLLIKWEAGDKEVIKLWKKMNSWVYEGFDKTYRDLGVDFDSYYYESKTYLLGKEIINEGLKNNIFFKKEDGSIWVDLIDEGLDEKILLRSDGTSVYMTQDLGTAYLRYKDYPKMNGVIYTVGNEQDYHFKVLFKILNKLGFNWSNQLHHLSYGMVDLPSGKMKSREGTVVDADELVFEMKKNASLLSEELGKINEFSEDEKENLNSVIGLGALKYFILKVDPKKRILFDPKESIDFNGNTGPFIQYAYARIQSLVNKVKFSILNTDINLKINIKEKNILKLLTQYPLAIKNSADNLSPALIANYTYELVKAFNSYYQSTSILKVDDNEIKNFRLNLSFKVGLVIKSSMSLLGVDVPNKM
ncbi:MAG: arginine--tRNA ligase [Flavobacteriaceae bacterium]|jgi:arginyl-tRNA synthetase|nr:arginine--tRNA ligase [Flavobacteriaceae bacterium]MBT6688382.1 arginine--tRNA ligase [Flavobacteriaceae bacterium]MBT7010862.1 arginine--tRNA ligase [Flavobacteriaceae bacterium]